MNRGFLKYFAIVAIAAMTLTGCEEEEPIRPCEQDRTGTLKLINKSALRFTVKIDGVNFGQIEARGVKEYVLLEGEKYVCLELSNAICYGDFTVNITPCEVEVITKSY